MNPDSVHIPVLLDEVIGVLCPVRGGVYIDGTLGGGGHTEAVVRQNGFVIGMDRDIDAINRTERRLRGLFNTEPFPVRFVHADYRYFAEALDLLNIDKIDGFLLDLGLSSDQLADTQRGFSFDTGGQLDLRFDKSEGKTGGELLATLKEEEIADIIFRYGEERFSRRIARKIAERHQAGQPVQTAAELAELVRRCVPNTSKIDPATRTFQALRIAVNDELGALETVLKNAPQRLKPSGITAVISFHSLEDRIVKQAFRDNPRWEVITKKPIVASEKEMERNPRARSAKLRAARLI